MINTRSTYLTVLLTGMITLSFAQVQDTCFERLFAVGEQLALMKGDKYINALDHFEAARACPDKSNEQEQRALEAIKTTRDAWVNALKRQLAIVQQERFAKEQERKKAVHERKRADTLRIEAQASERKAALNGALSEATKLALFADEQTDKNNGDDAIALGFMAMRWARDSVIQRVAKAYGNAIFLRDRRSFVGSEGAALGVEFSPGDGDFYLRKYNGPVVAYDDLQEIEQLEHSRHTLAMAFDPGGRRMISIGVDKMLVRESGSRSFQSHSNDNYKYTTAVFSPRGGAFITGGRAGALALWDRDVKHDLIGHTGHVTHIEFSRDGKLILSVATDNTIRVWTGAGAPVAVLEGHDRYINSAKFSDSGNLIVSAGSDGRAIVWRSSGEQIRSYTCDGQFTSAEIAPDETKVLTASTDNKVTLRGIVDDYEKVFEDYNDWVMGAGYLSSNRIYTWSKNRQMYIHDDQLNVVTQLANPHLGNVSEVIFSSDDMHFLVVQDKRVSLWDINGIEWMDPEPFKTHIWGAGFSPDGSHLWASTGTTSYEEAWYCILPRVKDDQLKQIDFSPTDEQFQRYQIRPLSELPKEED